MNDVVWGYSALFRQSVLGWITPDRNHADLLRPSNIKGKIITNHPCVMSSHTKLIERGEKNPLIWFGDTIFLFNKDSIKERGEVMLLDFSTLVSCVSITNEGERKSAISKLLYCLEGTRSKLTVLITKSFIAADHFRRKFLIFSSDPCQRTFYGFSPSCKWFEAIPPLLLCIVRNLLPIRPPTCSKGFFKQMRRKIQTWRELLTDMMPTLIRALRRDQKHSVHIKDDCLGGGNRVCHISSIPYLKRLTHSQASGIEQIFSRFYAGYHTEPLVHH